MTAKKLHTYQSDTITVTYDKSRCIHAAECVRGLPAVFDTSQRPWVRPEQAEAEAVVEVVLRCPTGALHFERQDGGPAEAPLPQNVIIADPDGPLYLRGAIEVQDSAGNVILEDTRVALCRCGASANKPFCDGSHHQIAFQAPGTLGRDQLGSPEVADGKLRVQTTADGPLEIEGSVALHSADGQTVYHGSSAELCRCGASANKPFCDYSHVAVGFTAE